MNIIEGQSGTYLRHPLSIVGLQMRHETEEILLADTVIFCSIRVDKTDEKIIEAAGAEMERGGRGGVNPPTFPLPFHVSQVLSAGLTTLISCLR